MKFRDLFRREARSARSAQEPSIYELWDAERAKAMTPAQRAEIDAIFSRQA